ncbi:hypothetical protein BC629DRAFT_1493962 [Irpex lacteus]|nr:hypothetical protein BC629DRAFT_1493962 [Irpex lacteus]
MTAMIYANKTVSSQGGRERTKSGNYGQCQCTSNARLRCIPLRVQLYRQGLTTRDIIVMESTMCPYPFLDSRRARPCHGFGLRFLTVLLRRKSSSAISVGTDGYVDENGLVLRYTTCYPWKACRDRIPGLGMSEYVKEHSNVGGDPQYRYPTI